MGDFVLVSAGNKRRSVFGRSRFSLILVAGTTAIGGAAGNRGVGRATASSGTARLAQSGPAGVQVMSEPLCAS
jgi:hypothetical protein